MNTLASRRPAPASGNRNDLPFPSVFGNMNAVPEPHQPAPRAEVMSTHDAALFKAAVRRAAELLRTGDIVALPTETVYGLAANALDEQAVARIFEAKGRPSHNPIIVHVADFDMARSCVSRWPAAADALSRAFWPGPLTMVLPKSKSIPGIVTAGGPTVGVRWPSHPFIQAVIKECGFPLAAPSANPSNQVSPTNAGHVLKTLGGNLKLIVDGGQSQVGIESAVIDLSESPFRMLRPGMISLESIQACLPEGEAKVEYGGSAKQRDAALRSPGQLPKHYAPKASLLVLSWSDPRDLESQLDRLKLPRNGVFIIAHTRIPGGAGFGGVSVIPHDAEAFARAIYAELHRCDEAGARWIIVESLPETSEWSGIADRLKRAAH